MSLSDLPLYLPAEENKMAERVYKTSIPGLWYVSTQMHEDDRGFYREIAVVPDIDTARGERFEIRQLNHSHSNTHVMRGIHAESWNKLITVTHGVCLCVFVDLRPESETFLKKEYVLIGYGSNNPLPGAIFVTRGIGNSFLTMEGPSEYIYAVDALYRDRDKSGDFAISLFDPDLNIAWPISPDQMIVSDRDKNSISMREKFPEKFS
ncbi:MAG: dTDP-4-dehydrorhamnose 3,5-epimerase family protein [Candidatus Levyibacteriota bacterium]